MHDFVLHLWMSSVQSVHAKLSLIKINSIGCVIKTMFLKFTTTYFIFCCSGCNYDLLQQAATPQPAKRIFMYSKLSKFSPTSGVILWWLLHQRFLIPSVVWEWIDHATNFKKRPLTAIYFMTNLYSKFFHFGNKFTFLA